MSSTLNAYERRKALRQTKASLRILQKRMDRIIHVHGLCLRYELAHKDAFGWTPVVDFWKGWYKVRGNWNRSYREKDFIKATEELYAIEHEKQLTTGQDNA